MANGIKLKYFRDGIVCYLMTMLQLPDTTDNIICSVEDNEIEYKYVNDEASGGGGRPLPLN